VAAAARWQIQGAGQHRALTGEVHHDCTVGAVVDWLVEADGWSSALRGGGVIE
jgi:hypothetical protein